MDSHPGSTWVHGGAEGFDTQVNDFALTNGFQPEVIPPDYNAYPPKQAPLERNKVIVGKCDLLVACYDGRKRGGTYQAINYALKQGKEIHYVPAVKIEKEDQPAAQAEETEE
jgi:predicted Rossmann fold nucleotide-binding protein DprA/Smf involved in DNA uptake